MSSTASSPHAHDAVPDSWRQSVAPYQQSNIRVSVWQLLNSIGPYFVMWYLMYRSLDVSYLLTLLLALPTAGFAMRMFIIFHDCGHGSFLPSKRWNDNIGRFTGVLLFTPYYAWRHSHAVHHASAGDLDRRGTGDIWTLTKDEFYKLDKWHQLAYRIYRNPLMIFVIGPIIDFVILQRMYTMNSATDEREQASVRNTNIALLVVLIIASLTIGLKAYLLVQIPIIAIASSVGVWMFYVQHQYENVYWERHENWDYATAALYGSSFYKLPRILQWFSGNIGFHHIHHLSPRIPNYELERCHNENEMFQVVPLTLKTSLKSMHIRLWDEDRHKVVGFDPHHQSEQLQGTDTGMAQPEV